MKAVIIITIAFVLLAPTTVFGAEGYFQSNWGKILSHEPVVCLFQPNDIEISDDIWKRYVTEMKTGIHSWNQALRQLGNGYWTLTIVEVPQNKLSLLNEYQCDIPVKFTKEINADNPNWLGWAYSNGDILLKYHRYEYCGTEYNSEYHITINKRCFSNDLERPKYVASVLQHEIGHTLGLGHYVGYDSRATQQWYDHGIGMPSIMTHQTSNEELKTVTKIDVDKIYEFYGSEGFGKKTDFTPMFNEPIIQEKIIEVSGRGDIHLSEGKTVSYSISGNVPDKLYKRGTYLEIIIQKPDGTTEYEATSVSKTLKTFNHNISFDYSDPSGQYKISLKFDETIFDKKEIQISKSSITSKTPVETTKFLPDIDGDGVPDKDDKCPRVFTLTDDGCPENTSKLENTAIEKLTQNLISKNDLNWAIAKKEDTKSSLLDIESKFKQSYNSLQQAEKDFVGDVPKNHIQKGFDMRMKILKGFPDLQGMGKSIIRNIETLEYEQNEGNVHSVIFSDIKWNVEDFEKDAKKMSSDMKYISQELDYAKQSFESSQPKTCFLMWCW